MGYFALERRVFFKTREAAIVCGRAERAKPSGVSECCMGVFVVSFGRLMAGRTRPPKDWIPSGGSTGIKGKGYSAVGFSPTSGIFRPRHAAVEVDPISRSLKI